MPRGAALVDGTTFHLLSPDDVRRRSVVEVFEHILTQDRAGEPKVNGVLDLRLGTVEPRFRCATCGGTVRTCAGHTGHIELPVPVYNVIFLPQILLVLRCLCCACARPLLSAERIRDLGAGLRRPQDRLAKIAGVAKDVAACPHEDCGMPVCSYAKTTAATAAADGGVSGIARQWSAAARAKLDPADRAAFAAPFTSCTAHALMSLVADDDWATLGFDRATTNPCDMIITVLVVPPAIVRPTSFHYDSGQGRGTNDLTAALQDIVRQAGKVRALLPPRVFDDVVRTLDGDDGAPAPVGRGPIDPLLLFEAFAESPPTPTLLTAIALLQQCVNAYIFNDPRSVAPTSTSGTAASARRQTIGGASSQRSGAPRTSVLGRLKGTNEQGGKVGRLRRSCLGKRSDNTARSVIVPDPALDIDELGVPQRIANTLAVRDRVCAYNLEDLSRRVRLGPTDGGAVSVIRAADADIGCGSAERDATIDLRSYDAAAHGPLVLCLGDVVERHVCDGDAVVFNRQPSLHRKSMMSFRARVVPDYAFHLNPAVTTPFNADYDGDEMNAHVATDVRAVAESRFIMSVGAQLLSGQTNSPCAGLVQDGIIGCWRLTDPRTRVSNDDAMDYAMQLDATHRFDGSDFVRLPPPVDDAGRRTGLQIASLPLPDDFTWSNESRTIVVVRGELVAGRLDKRAVGPGGVLLGALVRKCGPARALAAFSDLQRIALRFLERRGFSCGPRDSMLDPIRTIALSRSIDAVVRDAYAAAFDPTVTAARAQREAVVVRNLGALMDRIGRALPDALPADNALVEMHRSGAKGNAFNLCQITAALGQTLVEGRRPNPRADDAVAAGGGTSGGPFLPCCYVRTSALPSPDAAVLAADRGFIRQSYVRGLDPKAYFMHAMGGREGLVDTAVRTAESGYAQRKLMKALEDLKTEHDGTVRDAAGNIVQFRYGGDGYEPAELVRQRVDERIAARVAGAALLVIDRTVAAIDDVRCTLPFYVTDIVEAANAATPDASDGDGDGDGTEIFTAQETIVLRDLLDGRPPHAVRAGLRAAAAAVDRARVHPGENVGGVAAHSIAQPATQMTLNSFHVAGKSQRHALGVGRIYELVDVRGRRDSSSVVVEVPVRAPWRDAGPRIARSMKRALVAIAFRALVARFEVVPTYRPIRRPPPFASASWRGFEAQAQAQAAGGGGDATDEDRWLAVAVALGEIDCADEKRRPHDRCLRFELSPSAMSKHGIDLEQARVAVEQTLRGGSGSGGKASARSDWIVVAGDGASRVIRAYCASARGRATKSAAGAEDACAARGRQLMASMIVRGVRGVSTVEHDGVAHAIRVCGSEALSAVLATRCDALDYQRLYCNSPIACAARLGLDYAGAILASELWRVMRSNGTYVDGRHVALLADSMTHRGYMVPINRHGLNRLDTDPMVRCCFEQPTDVIRNAALHAESSVMRSVSERVVFGQPVFLGTGTVEIRDRERTPRGFVTATATMHCTEIGLLPQHFCDLRSTNRAELGAYMQPAPATCAPVPSRLANVWRTGIELLSRDDASSIPSATTEIVGERLLPPSKRAAQSLSDARDPLRLHANGRRRGTLKKYRLPRRIRSPFRPSTPAPGSTVSVSTEATNEPAPPRRRFLRRGPRWRPWSPSADPDAKAF